MGVGDRFGRQAEAQLQAFQTAAAQGVIIVPVWNKSNREHHLIGSEPIAVRRAADAAIQAVGWAHSYYVDADHIGLKTVDRFITACDFFTIDVADDIGKPPAPGAVKAFMRRHPELEGDVEIPGMERPIPCARADAEQAASKFLRAIEEAGRVYRRIGAAKAEDSFIAELSMDETDRSQTPLELLIILAAIADENIPIQTLAPKFTGRFNKGVDYVGDVIRFEREFNDDLCVIRHAIRQYRLPANLKLSVHSGSDKFSLYKPIRDALKRHNAGLHLKTAGTTWLEELTGLAESGGDGLILAKQIYEQALAHLEELCAPYASVIDIDRKGLPSTTSVNGWTREQFVRALRHDPSDPQFNPSLRQLLHVGFKVAARLGSRYLQQLEACKPIIARNVTRNLLERHIRPLFLMIPLC